MVSDASVEVEQSMSFDVWGKRREPENWTLSDGFVELGPVHLGDTGHEAQKDGGLINMGGVSLTHDAGQRAGPAPARCPVCPIRTDMGCSENRPNPRGQCFSSPHR
ncbi:MAG: hypothetical protein R6X02_36195 [Enhygromyxa sp.]